MEFPLPHDIFFDHCVLCMRDVVRTLQQLRQAAASTQHTSRRLHNGTHGVQLNSVHVDRKLLFESNKNVKVCYSKASNKKIDL